MSRRTACQTLVRAALLVHRIPPSYGRTGDEDKCNCNNNESLCGIKVDDGIEVKKSKDIVQLIVVT